MKEITHLEPNEIFVFGSNYAGIHGKGAAKTALRFGAIRGQGTGLIGQTYGIATKDRNLGVLSLFSIQAQIRKFLEFANDHPELKFLVTSIGCGLARYKPKDIAPLFFYYKIPLNVVLPDEFLKFR